MITLQWRIIFLFMYFWMKCISAYPANGNNNNKYWKIARAENSKTEQQTETHPQLLACPKEGFFRHPEDCRRFYRCVDMGGKGDTYLRYQFDCAPGTVFDERISVCNHPRSAPPCDEESTGEGPEGKATDKPLEGDNTTDSFSGSGTEVTESDLTTESVTGSSNIDSATDLSSAVPVTDEGNTNDSEQSNTASTAATTPCQCPDHGNGEQELSGSEHSESTTVSPQCNHTHGTPSSVTNQPSGETGESTDESSVEEPSPTSIDEPEGGEIASNQPEENSTGSTTEADKEEGGSTEEPTSEGEESEISQGTPAPESSTLDGEDSESSHGSPTSETSPFDGEDTDYFVFQILCGNKPGYRRHPLYCDRYYKCLSDGETIDFTVLKCAEGEVYSNGAGRCLAESEGPTCNAPKKSRPVKAHKKKNNNKHRRSKRQELLDDFMVSMPQFYLGKLNICPNETYLSSYKDCVKHFDCIHDNKFQPELRILYTCPEGYLLLDVPHYCSNEVIAPCGASFNHTITKLMVRNGFHGFSS